jgi:hypothetical protein
MNTATPALRLSLYADRFVALVREASELLAAVDPIDLLPEPVRRFVDDPQRLSGIARIEARPAPGGTLDRVLAIEPTDAFLELVLALRARHGDGTALGDQIGHGGAPVVDSQTR